VDEPMLRDGKIDENHYIFKRMNNDQRHRIFRAHNLILMTSVNKEAAVKRFLSILDGIVKENENWYHDMEFETKLADEKVPLSLEPEDFDDMIELALATNDREWFEELAIRKKFINLKHRQA
jgi:hypothetical protein